MRIGKIAARLSEIAGECYSHIRRILFAPVRRALALDFLLVRFAVGRTSGHAAGRNACNVTLDHGKHGGMTLVIERTPGHRYFELVQNGTHSASWHVRHVPRTFTVRVFNASALTFTGEGLAIPPPPLLYLRLDEKLTARVVLRVVVWRARRAVRKQQSGIYHATDNA